MESRNGFSIFLIFALALFMCVAIALMHNGSLTISGNEPSLPASVFRIVNAATLTGFQGTSLIDDYRLSGQLVMFGLIVGGTLVALIVGGVGVARALDMPFDAGQVTLATVLIYGVSTLVGATVLAFGGLPVWPAIFQAASAFGNCGLVIGTVYDASNWQTHFVLLPLAVIGGLSIPVILDLAQSLNRDHSLHQHTRLVLTMTAGVYLLGMLFVGGFELLAVSDYRAETPTTTPFMVDANPAILNASAEVLNSRTLGMPLGSFQNLTFASRWVVLLLMIIGGNSASVSGGIKANTLLVFIRDSFNALRGKPVGRIFGLAGVWIVAYLFAILITTVLLIYAAPQALADRMLFLAVSAVGTVGTSHTPVNAGNLGLYVLSGAMLFGRFVPLFILIWAGEHLSVGRTIR